MKKKPSPHTVKLVSSLTALVALGSALISNVDPVNCMIRGALGYMVGKALAGIWCALLEPTTVGPSSELETEPLAAEDAEGNHRAAA